MQRVRERERERESIRHTRVIERSRAFTRRERASSVRTVSSRLNRTEFTGAWKRSWTVFAHTRVIRRQKSCRLMQRVIVLRRVQSRSTSAHTDFRRRFIDASRTHTRSLRSSGDGSWTLFFSFRDASATTFCVTETHSCATILCWGSYFYVIRERLVKY